MADEKKNLSFYALRTCTTACQNVVSYYWFGDSVEDIFENLEEKWLSLQRSDVSLLHIELGKKATLLATIDGDCTIHIPEDKNPHTINTFPYQKYPDLDKAPKGDVFVCKNCQTFQSVEMPCLICKDVKG